MSVGGGHAQTTLGEGGNDTDSRSQVTSQLIY